MDVVCVFFSLLLKNNTLKWGVIATGNSITARLAAQSIGRAFMISLREVKESISSALTF
jgi:hypothetical protein